MRGTLHERYRVLRTLRKTPAASAFIVRDRLREDDSLVLKAYSGPLTILDKTVLENELSWHIGLDHPHLLGIAAAHLDRAARLSIVRPWLPQNDAFPRMDHGHLKQLLGAIAFLHRHSRIHGSIRPSNIFVTEQGLRLADSRFAVLSQMHTAEDIRSTAPELFSGGLPTRDGDYYSLGAILYRLYAGRDPFEDPVLDNLKAKYLYAGIPPLGNFCDAPDWLSRAVDGLLNRNPLRRSRSFRELLEGLEVAPAAPVRAPMSGRRETIQALKTRMVSREPVTLQATVIEGEAGIGKTRLLEELTARAGIHSMYVYSVACVPDAGGLNPIIRLADSVLRKRRLIDGSTVPEELGRFSGTLAPLMANGGDGQTADGGSCPDPNERIVQDFIGLFGAISQRETLRLCIEDIENADAATQRFLELLCYRASELNVRLILTCGQPHSRLSTGMEGILGTDFYRVGLKGLTTPEALDLLQFMESDRGRQSALLGHAGGNPRLLLEAAAGDDHLSAAQRSFGQSYRRVFQEMGEGTLDLVQALAVHRGPAPALLLARIAGQSVEQAAEKLSRLQNAGVLDEKNACFEFRSANLRAAVEAELSVFTRRSLHRTWYEMLAAFDFEGETLERRAEHAYEGALWEQALSHYSELARRAARRGRVSHAVKCFERWTAIATRLNRKLPPSDQIAFAECLAKAGRRKAAARIYDRLLADSETHEDEQLCLTLLSRCAQLNRGPLSPTLETLKRSIEAAQGRGADTTQLHSKLSTAAVRAGDLRAAAESLEHARRSLERFPNGEGRTFVAAAEAFLCMGQGRFAEAMEMFRSLERATPAMTAPIYTNIAVCLEQLGRIRGARAVQGRAYGIALKTGHLLGQLWCLINLGAFATKLGDFKKARRHFGNAKELAERAMEKAGPHATFRNIQGEEARLDMLEGKYRLTRDNVQAALASDSLFRSERLQLQLLFAEMRLLECEPGLGRKLSSEIEPNGMEDTPLFSIQRDLLRARAERSISKAIEILAAAIAAAQKASLVYEECRLLLEYCRRSIQADDPDNARKRAGMAFDIAKKNGYRPLLADAMLLRGRTADHWRAQEQWLQRALRLAEEIGTAETLAESAYQLGALMLVRGRPAEARELLLRSTALISELAEQIPARHRLKYLAEPWRESARKRLEECVHQQPSLSPRAEAAAVARRRENQYFRALYRASIAAKMADSAEGYVSSLIDALERCLRHPAVVLLQRDDNISWHPLRTELGAEIRKQVLALSNRSSDRVHFDYRNGRMTQGAIAWVPFCSAQCSGGIYVWSRKRDAMDESDMEFLTILGQMSSGAFDQICNRALVLPAAAESDDFCGIVGASAATRNLRSQIEIAAANNATVLIEGETGTGKELVARAIHQRSARANGPFIAVDCGAIPESLIESELFGVRKGSFTGAVADRQGLFESADRGTLFLDEISNMNPGTQAKLLRVLQEREVRRVGETRGRQVDVRIVAAANVGLRTLVDQGKFRQDLLYRLNVLEIVVAPLRNRREDIPVLAAHFLRRLNSDQKTAKVFAPDALAALARHRFPGNVRELQNAVERGFFLARGRTIATMPLETVAHESETDDVQLWLEDLAQGRKTFWTGVHDRYKNRDISREQVVALVDLGLRNTHGSYKALAALFRIRAEDYRRLMDFLRRNKCLLDFRPYRKTAVAP